MKVIQKISVSVNTIPKEKRQLANILALKYNAILISKIMQNIFMLNVSLINW
jgi:hypothetical protein